MHHLRLLLPVLFMLWLSACAPVTVQTAPSSSAEEEAPPPAEEAPAPAEEEAPSPPAEEVSLGVGFIPNVQFTPYYVAQAKGFYAEEGLDVTLEHGFEHDFVTLTAQGERDFSVASGDQVILARAQGLPLVYVMKWYDRFPVGVMALAESGIDGPEALAGHSVGIPGLFGASFAAWKALVYSTGLDETTVDLQEIGFTQAAAISENQVDAAVVYLANEPIQLSEAGMEVNVIEVSEYINLVSNGVVTNETVINEQPELVRALVQGSLRGLAYTIENPDEAFEIARTFIPEMTDEDAPTQKMVLERSIDLWRSSQPGLSSAEAWAESAEFMLAAGMIDEAVDVESLYTNEFVE